MSAIYRLNDNVITKPLTDGSGFVFFVPLNNHTHLLRVNPDADASVVMQPTGFTPAMLSEVVCEQNTGDVQRVLQQLLKARVVTVVELGQED